MKYRTIYRICLLAVIILTLAGGIFYYMKYVERQETVTDGTLVMETSQGQPLQGQAMQAHSAGKPGEGCQANGHGEGLAARREKWRQTPFI